MITYRCGCTNDRDEPSGVLRCMHKCAHHRRYAEKHSTGFDYYHHLGAITADGMPVVAHYLAQLVEALGPIPKACRPGALAFEIGGGASPYVWAIQEAGYSYIGVEPDPWAAAWMKDTYGVFVNQVKFPDGLASELADLMVCIHALEHMEDAPAAFKAMVDRLRPGGSLIVVVPDDSDPLNPDHLWFFDERSLLGLAERSGLVDITIAKRKYIEREHFLYLKASQPGV